MLRIDPIPALHAQASVVATVEYAPTSSKAVVFELEAAHGARICHARATLLDGTHLAARLRPGPAGVRLTLGQLEVAVLLHVTLRAHVPVTTACATLRVRAGEETQVAQVALVGRPAFLAARSRLQLSADEVRPGGELALTVVGTNDGTAVAHDARLQLLVPDDVALDAGPAAWREVSPAGERSIVIPIDRVQVGERLCHQVAVAVAPVSQDRREVLFVGWLSVGEVRFDLEPVTLVVRSAAHAVARLKIIDNRLYRFGDRVRGVVSVKAHGTDVVRDAVVRVTSAGISWAGGDHENGVSVPFGTVAPFAQASRLIEGVVIASPSGEQPVAIALHGVAASGTLQAHGTSLDVLGAARVHAALSVAAADGERAHQVELVLRNTGDGSASSVVVTFAPIGEVVGVVDSLLIDGQPRFALDGSLPIEREGLEVGPLGIAAERRIAWRIRSAVAQRTAVATSITVDGTAIAAHAVAELVAGVRREQGARPAGGVPAAVPDATFAQAGDPLPATAAGAGPLTQADQIHEDTEPVTDTEDIATAQDAPADDRLCVHYEIGARAAARWSAWFGEAGPSPDAPLGMHVLAVRELLPVGAASAAADAALAGIRSESESVVRARLESYKVLGVFGASGFDFGTPRLRSAVGSLIGILGREPHDLAGPGLDRALVAMAGAAGTAWAEVVEQYRDALALVLADVDEPSRYADPAPEMVAPARALFEALVRAAVAA
jgi:hypothetical protein